MAPVYVSFAVPQRVLVDLRESMAKGASGVTATIPGHQRSETGKVAMVENTVDATTGMVTVRGIMNNENESLWPGTLVATKLVIRSEDSIVVPTVAVQRSQSGNFVFVIKDGVAKVQPVKVDRTAQGMSVIIRRARRWRKRRRRRAIAAVGWNAGRGRGPKRPERNR